MKKDFYVETVIKKFTVS